jgi:primosomal replication protein N
VNALQLAGRIAERGPLRYTPAGLPVVDMLLAHASTQPEAGQDRDIRFEMSARAIGRAAQGLDALVIGANIQASGFLARRSHRSKALLFHIRQFELVAHDVVAQ